jgi:hypothetical protein
VCNKSIVSSTASSSYFSTRRRSFFFLNSLSGVWSPTGSTRHGDQWLTYCSPPRGIMMMENLVEWRLAGETEVFGENPPQRHFVHHKSHFTRPAVGSYGAARRRPCSTNAPNPRPGYITVQCRPSAGNSVLQCAWFLPISYFVFVWCILVSIHLVFFLFQAFLQLCKRKESLAHILATP